MTRRKPYDWSDGAAATYGTARALGPEAQEQWKRALAGVVRASDLVLDLGCGVGLYTRYLAEWFGCDVFACDPSSDMLAAGRSVTPSVARWVRGSAHSLPFASDVLDVVWLSNVVHHLDLALASTEVARVLGPAGRVAIRNVFPDHASEMPLYRFFPEARASDDETYPTIADVCDAFTLAGLGLARRATVWQVTATTWDEYLERTRLRAVSSLRLISDEAFGSGLDRLAAHATATDGEVTTPMELLIFEHA